MRNCLLTRYFLPISIQFFSVCKYIHTHDQIDEKDKMLRRYLGGSGESALGLHVLSIVDIGGDTPQYVSSGIV